VRLIGVDTDWDQVRNSSPSDWPQSLCRRFHFVTPPDIVSRAFRIPRSAAESRSRRSCENPSMRTLRLIGYWRSNTDPDWPDAHDFVDESWDERVRNLVAGYLANGTVLAGAAGVSTCRLCGKANGSSSSLTACTCGQRDSRTTSATIPSVCPRSSLTTFTAHSTSWRMRTATPIGGDLSPCSSSTSRAIVRMRR
jgi:hypothetical protein